MKYEVVKEGRSFSKVVYDTNVNGHIQEYCTCFTSLRYSKKEGYKLVDLKGHDKAQRIARALTLLDNLEKINSKTTKKEILNLINATGK